MRAERNNKPLIPHGWLRTIIFVVVYFAVLLLAELLLTMVQLKNAGNTATTGFNYLVFVVAAIVSMALVWLFTTFIDRRSFNSIGFGFTDSGMHAGTGFFTGIFLVCAGAVILYFTKHLQWTGISFNGQDLFISFGLMAIVAIYEETVFRGYILNNLLQSVNKWLALFISAFIFALAHIANPGVTTTGGINILLAGLLLGTNYIYTKNLWFSILLHFTWNFVQGPLLGFDVSGLPLKSLLQHDILGNELITGGKFGFEGSLVATVLCTLAVFGLLWIYEKKYAPLPASSITTTS